MHRNHSYHYEHTLKTWAWEGEEILRVACPVPCITQIQITQNVWPEFSTSLGNNQSYYGALKQHLAMNIFLGNSWHSKHLDLFHTAPLKNSCDGGLIGGMPVHH